MLNLTRYIPTKTGHVTNLLIFLFTVTANLARFFEFRTEVFYLEDCHQELLTVQPTKWVAIDQL